MGLVAVVHTVDTSWNTELRWVCTPLDTKIACISMIRAPRVLDPEIVHSIFRSCTHQQCGMVNIPSLFSTIRDNSIRIAVETARVNQEASRAIFDQICNENVLAVVGTIGLTHHLRRLGLCQGC